MFDQRQKPFLKADTGEAYQPVRLSFDVYDPERLEDRLDELDCVQCEAKSQKWAWYWRGECEHTEFDSMDSFDKVEVGNTKLGILLLDSKTLHIDLPSFKRACLAAKFFSLVIDKSIATISFADFLNKVFPVSEHRKASFADLFNTDELAKFSEERQKLIAKIEKQCAEAATEEEAWHILAEYSQKEAEQPLPYAERYDFRHQSSQSDDEALFLGFYIFLRGRELVAIKRWLGDTNYGVNDAVETITEQVFGTVDTDLV